MFDLVLQRLGNWAAFFEQNMFAAGIDPDMDSSGPAHVSLVLCRIAQRRSRDERGCRRRDLRCRSRVVHTAAAATEEQESTTAPTQTTTEEPASSTAESATATASHLSPDTELRDVSPFRARSPSTESITTSPSSSQTQLSTGAGECRRRYFATAVPDDVAREPTTSL